MKFTYVTGATPIDPNEAEGLIPEWVATQSELNSVEHENILKASRWAHRGAHELVTEPGVRELHRRMFGDVWRWAGQFRRTDKNIGIDWPQIPIALRQAMDDLDYWFAMHTYGLDEICARFHHRMVSIHCFPNGNGRHARLVADLLLVQHGGRPFSWGGESIADQGDMRDHYISSLRQADAHDFAALLRFVRA